ncbi:MAG: thioredoxin-like domain-containing protein [Pirellulaceae bacterium]|nr:thioredoxin-like domain-containing protein [Pirellulaceae bacterium]
MIGSLRISLGLVAIGLSAGLACQAQVSGPSTPPPPVAVSGEPAIPQAAGPELAPPATPSTKPASQPAEPTGNPAVETATPPAPTEPAPSTSDSGEKKGESDKPVENDKVDESEKVLEPSEIPPPDPAAKEEVLLAQAPARNDAAPKAANPFRRRVSAPEFPKGLEWINSRPLTKADLKGKFVLLDFWTYCCINCMHILPELKKLEQEFPNELVVIGVHSAKFETEKDAENIRAAVLRYEIEHAVVNDNEHAIWDTYGVSSWPTIVMIDPEGNGVWGNSGEFKAEAIREVLNNAIPWYREQKLLDEKPFHLELEAFGERDTPLRFPGKILADERGNRLFISDSNHNRIVIASLDGSLLDIIGSGAIGRADGDFKSASFNHPQGCFLHGDTLYVADTENHLLRKVDLKTKTVATIAGTGEQAAHAWPGLEQAQAAGRLPERWVGPPSTTALNSPWALWVHDKDLYIAMAGPHQIWKMPLDELEIGPYAGNGREDIVDGPLLPRTPYMQGFSSFAQPSGLSADATGLYVADSEGSSIRKVPFDPKKQVTTVLGSDNLPGGRLFAFGDRDGPRSVAKLQHCLEVVHVAGKLYVADTYNHKIKVVDAKTGECRTLAGINKNGIGAAGSTDDPPAFHEPAGLAHAKGKLYVADTNNHLIRVLDLATNKVTTLAITGLAAPGASPNAPAAAPKKPSFKGAVQEKVAATTLKPVDGKVNLKVSLKIPAGWKVNDLAPMSYWVDATAASGPIDRAALGRVKLPKPVAEFDVAVPVTSEGEEEVTISLTYYYCEDKREDGTCKVGSVVFTVPLKVAADGAAGPVKLAHTISE